MNIAHLKYAIEVERTGSISRAAENLYMAQPHLSKAIKELEESMGIIIFSRTPKGVLPTQKGRDFLDHAKKIIAQIDEMEEMYKPNHDSGQKFSISVPRATYISQAFAEMMKCFDFSAQVDVNYRETNTMETIKSVTDETVSVGIIRVPREYEKYFMDCLEERGLKHTVLWELEYRVLMSELHPLANAAELDCKMLDKYTEVVHGDVYIPSLPIARARELARADESKNKIAIYERASQYEILQKIPTTFMWVSPVPREIADAFSLIQKKCSAPNNCYKDIFIYRKDYRKTANDRLFTEKLMETIEKLKRQRLD